MKTPAQKRREMALAQKAGDASPAAQKKHANGYELMLAKLDSDKRALKRIQSIERKIGVKSKLLPDYEDWVKGVLTANTGAQDDVLATVMVWRIDVGDFAGALPLAAYALKHQLALPEQYARTLGCLFAEEVADAALKVSDTPPDLKTLQETQALTAEEDMPDEVRAKLMKAIGLAFEQAGQFPDAEEALTGSLRLNPKAGVKKDIERVRRTAATREKESTASG